MAIAFIQQRKIQKYLIFILILALFLLVIVIWKSVSKKSEVAVAPEEPLQPVYEPVEIDFGFLESLFLTKLQAFEKIKPLEGKKGRRNPFLPYTYPEVVEWRKFTSPDSQFNALLPAFPGYETEALQIPGTTSSVRVDVYTSEVDNIAYVITVTTFPPEVDTSDAEARLRGALAGTAASFEGGEIISSSFTNFSGFRALNFLIGNKSKDIYLKGRLILAGKTLYQLFTNYDSASYSEEEYNRFVDSLQLIK